MPLSIDDLIDRLAASKLLSADDARSVLSSVAESNRPIDGESLATLLVKSGKLTSFQAQRLCEGKPESLVLGNYLLLDRIGRGGMGDVFKAEHRRMKRVVALKVVKPEILDSPTALKRFQREVETVAKLDHPNIVVAHDADEAHSVNFLVMQFVDGRDLSSVVKTNGPLPIANSVDCVLQAARGLAYAHDQGIVHRDIKPGNLLLDKKGLVKILDLGLATLMGREAGRNESLTASEMIVGTLDYMAPEQAENSKLADPRSDIYSLGMTLYFLLTGRPAYESESVIEKLLAHREKPAPSLVGQAASLPSTPASGRREPPGNVISDLDPIFQKMVAKQPADRYQSMAEVAAALEEFQKTHSSLSNSTIPALSDATSAWAHGTGNCNVTQRHGGTENDAVPPTILLPPEHDSPPSVDQTASLLSPISETTATRRKPKEITASAQNRPRRRFAVPIALAAASLIVLSGGIWFTSKRWRSPDKDLAVSDGASVAATDSPVPAAAPNPKSKIENPKSPPPLAIAPFDTAQARAHQEAWANYLGVPVEQTNSIGMKLRLIPPGEFMMGSTSEQVEANLKRAFGETIPTDPISANVVAQLRSEAPRHLVRLRKPFLMAETEVTVGQFRQFVESTKYETETAKLGGGRIRRQAGYDPARLWNAPGYPVADDSPVTQVTWNDCVAFCNWLSEQSSLKPSYERNPKEGWVLVAGADGYRLPTEAEWEYACRAGTTTAHFFGDDEVELVKYGWHLDAKGQPRAVGLKPGNAFGLRDMHGNAFEWCHDRWGAQWYEQSVRDDPTGPVAGNQRVHRSGDVTEKPVTCRSACRFTWAQDGRGSTLGFRVARTLPVPTQILKSEIENPKSAAPFSNFALEFNGKDSYVEVPLLRYEGGHPLTVEAQVTPGENTSPQAVVHVRGSNGFVALSRNGGNWYAYARTGDREFVSDVAGVQPGKRSHLAAVWNGIVLRLFVDGRPNAIEARAIEPRPHEGSSLLGAVGTPEETASKPWCLQGGLDEVRVSKVARYTTDFTPQSRFEPDADTLALYHFDEGSGDILTDSSGNNHHGKIVNAKWVPGIAAGPAVAPAPARDYALEFDASHGIVEIASLKETPESLTVEATVRFTGTPPSGRNMVAVSSDSQSYGLWGYAPLAGITWVDANNAAHVAQSGWNQFPTGQALRLAGVVDRGQTRLFVNGKLAPGSSKVQPFLGYFRAGALIGGELTKDGTTMTFQGVIDEVRISNTARYDREYRVADRLAADSQTLALYHFDEGAGDILTDSSGNNHHGKIVNANWVPGIADGPPATK